MFRAKFLTHHLTHKLLQPLIIGGVFVSGVSAAHACTPPKSDYKNIRCTAQSDTFLATKDNGEPVALLDRQGKKIVDLFSYQAVLANQYQAGLLPVLKNGKVGYINRQGKVVIGFNYDKMPSGSWARGVSDDRIIAYANGRYVILSASGRLIRTFDRNVSQMTDYHNGVATVVQNTQRYEIDKQGNRIAPTAPIPATIATTTTTTVSTTAAAQNMPQSVSQNTLQSTPQNPSIASINTASTTINPAANAQPISRITLIQPQIATQAVQTAQQTNQPANTTTLIKKQQAADGKWGFVDRQGNLRILYAFDEVRDYSEGLAAVRQGNYWGFIDEKADLVINFQFHKDGIHAGSQTPKAPNTPLIFEHGKAWIGNLGNGTKMCINTAGKDISCS
ncbi:WG repeat-containing protein [Moraxella sp. ZJ142]|uniref:WG repeat-containing protein n=1 Tax=Moraxella marmotae TaxID=3344520 RepID=UPI0035D3F478